MAFWRTACAQQSPAKRFPSNLRRESCLTIGTFKAFLGVRIYFDDVAVVTFWWVRMFVAGQPRWSPLMDSDPPAKSSCGGKRSILEPLSRKSPSHLFVLPQELPTLVSQRISMPTLSPLAKNRLPISFTRIWLREMWWKILTTACGALHAKRQCATVDQH